ncbi:hypothetical protein KAI52_04405 [Candidatus Parcubacteria bacterium]|nr:hypothetical protein [Candidatus Parcubacteria bacterium]
MLNFKEKLAILNKILSRDEKFYADSFNAEILIEINNLNSKFNFLKNFNSEKSIENWVNKLKSRIVMHEDDDKVEEIINDYIDCG